MNEEPRKCVSCREPLGGKYCARCGEKCLGPEDFTIRHFFENLFVAFTNADGKIFLSLRQLLTRPGQLTADYLQGRRKPYIPPLELFLIGNLVFFLLHPLIGSDTLTTDLNTQLHYSWHHEIARVFVAPRLAARALTVEAYAATFDPMAVTLARSLVILVVPIFSVAVMALYWWHRRHYAAHIVFSLHFCAFWLLLTCATLAGTNLVVRLLRCINVFPTAVVMSVGTFAVTLAIMTAYLFCAVRRVFARESAGVTAVKALLLGLALPLSLQAYRFVLFFITFWFT